MSQGGLGPIWPGGKPPPGQPLKEAQEAFQTHKEVSAPGTKSTAGASKVAETSPQVQSQKTQDAGPVTKVSNLTVADINRQLANMKGVSPSEANQNLALLMAAHGIEISEETFSLVHKLLKGKKVKTCKRKCYIVGF